MLETQMIGRRFLSHLGLSVAAWACAAAMFIAVIDPYGVSMLNLALPYINVLKPKRVDIDRLIKPYEVALRQPATVFLGTSRIHQSFDPSVLNGTAYAPAYNSAVPAASIPENIALLKQYAAIDRRLRHVFFEVFVYAFNDSSSEVANRGLSDVVADLPKMHFSSSAVVDTLLTIAYNIYSRSEPPSIAQGGFEIHEHAFDPSVYFVPHNFAQFVLDANQRAGGKLRVYQSALDMLQQAQSFCDEKGIELTFIVAPNYPWDDYRLLSTGDWHIVRELYSSLANLPRVYSFAQINELTAEPISPQMRYWNDYFHFSLPLGAKMLKALVGLPDVVPANFMVPINHETLEARLSERETSLHFATLFDATRDAVKVDGRATGDLDVERKMITVDGVSHPIVSEIAGTVEAVNHGGADMTISGWAADTRDGIPVANIVGAVGAKVVSKWFPGTPRVDVEAKYGRGVRPSNFVMHVAGQPPEPNQIRVFAVMQDGRAVQLKSTNNMVSGSQAIALGGQP
jgi:hypothetical protein